MMGIRVVRWVFLERDTHMRSILRSLRAFLIGEDGPTAVEYAVMLALIIIVALASIQILGTRTSATFNNIATQLPAS
jgi:pilus assembly protein Flp/PilA